MENLKKFLLFGVLAFLCYLGTALAMPNIETLTRIAIKLLCVIGFVSFAFEAVKSGLFALADLLQAN